MIHTVQGSADVDTLGNPYGFNPTPLPHHTPSFPVLVTSQMSRPRSVNQLILLSDGHYLSSSTASLSLRLVAYNADAHALTYAKAVFEWQDAGEITATPPFILALPVLAYASYAPSRSAAIVVGACCYPRLPGPANDYLASQLQCLLVLSLHCDIAQCLFIAKSLTAEEHQ